ncbi:MAG: D-aminoacyl-tRNA deacylase [candidate division WOR-3 bacterium]
MTILVQRVNWARVSCSSGKEEGIGKGILVYVGFERGDNEGVLEKGIRKILNLRIFEDENGKMNLSVKDIGGEIMLVPNFTLAGNAQKGNRPSFDNALNPEEASKLFDKLYEMLKGEIPLKTGVFRDHMIIQSENDGPVNIIIKL